MLLMLKPPLYILGILACFGLPCIFLMAPQQSLSQDVCVRECVGSVRPWRTLEMEKKKKLPSSSRNVSCVAKKHRLLFTMPFIDPTSSRPLCIIYFTQLLHGCNKSLSELIVARADRVARMATELRASTWLKSTTQTIHTYICTCTYDFMHKYSSKGCPDLQ